MTSRSEQAIGQGPARRRVALARAALAAAAATSFFLTPTAAAGHGHGCFGGGMGAMPDLPVDRLTSELGLDQATAERLHAIMERAGSEARTDRQKLREARSQLKALMTSDPPDTEAVMRQVDRVGRLETLLRKQQIVTTLRIRRLLTVEQRQKLRSLRTSEPRQPPRPPPPDAGGAE